MKKLFSIVIPIYKAEDNIPHTIPYIMEKIPELFPAYDVELVLVNDGSPDNSWVLLKEWQAKYPETIRIIRLVHNFGQGNATNCGIASARGDIIGVISQDMQDPFELFADMLRKIEHGHDLVCACREARNERGLGAACSKMTHWFMHTFASPQYPLGGCDFFAMTKTVAKRYLAMFRNGSMLLAMLYASESPAYLPYTRMKREYGKSGFTLRVKVLYAMALFTSSTYTPLRFVAFLGFFVSVFSALFTLVILTASLTVGSPVPVRGWASTALLITFFSGLNLITLGMLGEYLCRVYEEVKQKPAYFVAETIESEGLHERAAQSADASGEEAD